VYKGQTSYVLGGFANWRVALYDMTARTIQALTIRTTAGTFSTSFGAPMVQVMPGPNHQAPVLVVTMFVYAAGPGEGGELIYYQPA